ncbi:TetR family transcriptional regulator [Klebsiella sp. NPDC088457]
MSGQSRSLISIRKKPRQARSTELVAAIIQAALQVLQQEGAARFTTARVAEKAGVSVGSVYQYFPNKAAILFRLQSDEWQQTTAMLTEILENQSQPPLARLRALVHAFIRSECAEAGLRQALNDAAPLYRDAPEAEESRATGEAIFHRFIHEVLPQAAEEKRHLAAELLTTTLSSVGSGFSGSPRTADEIRAFSEAMADMLCAWLTEWRRAGEASAAAPPQG